MYSEDVSDSTGGTTYEEEYGDPLAERTALHNNPTQNDVVVSTKKPTKLKQATQTAEGTMQLLIYPNPAQDKINIELTSKAGGAVKILLINGSGVLIRKITAVLSIGQKHIDINTRSSRWALYNPGGGC